MSTAVARSTRSFPYAWFRAAALLAGAAAVVFVGYWVLQSLGDEKVSAPPVDSNSTVDYVSAIGRLEPKSRVVQLAAPMAMEPARIDRLRVQEGDTVQEGQVLAVLDTYARRAAAVEEAQARVAVAEAQLAQVKAGAKPGEIAAQEAAVRREEATLENAKLEHRRAAALAQNNAITRSELDRLRTEEQTAERSLEQSRATLAALNEVREVDVQHAEAELQAAQAAVAKAKADVDATELRAPFAARILRIHSRPGEKVGDKGVFEIADTANMQAVAEVYEGDIGRVRLGQPATVRIPAMDLTLQGEVEMIGNLIGRKDVFDNDPVADTDARVVEVRIHLDPQDAERVERLTNLRIEIRIEVSGE